MIRDVTLDYSHIELSGASFCILFYLFFLKLLIAQSWWTDLTEDTIRGGLYLKSDQCYFNVDYKNDSISEFYDYYLLTICTVPCPFTRRV